jgi:hypothetical protein
MFPKIFGNAGEDSPPPIDGGASMPSGEAASEVGEAATGPSETA